MLYTKEFFELVKSRLNPGGVVTIFVQLYESSEEAAKSEIATFLDAFPNGMVFANTVDGAGYDLVLLGSERPVKIDIDAMEARLQRPEYAPVAFSLSEVGIQSALQLLANYAGGAGDLRHWTKDAQINHDRNLRLQYLAGLGLNLRQSAAIYSAMVTRRRFPDGLFVGTDASVTMLRQAIEGGY